MVTLSSKGINVRNFGKSGGLFCKIRKKSDSKFENPEKIYKGFPRKKKNYMGILCKMNTDQNYMEFFCKFFCCVHFTKDSHVIFFYVEILCKFFPDFQTWNRIFFLILQNKPPLFPKLRTFIPFELHVI